MKLVPKAPARGLLMKIQKNLRSLPFIYDFNFFIDFPSLYCFYYWKTLEPYDLLTQKRLQRPSHN